MTRLLKTRETAEEMRITERLLLDKARAGQIPFAVKVSERQWRFSEQGLRQFIESGGILNRPNNDHQK